MDILRADASGAITLPDGSKVDAALADALGFVVLGAKAPTLEARADAAARVAGAKARAAVLRPQAAPAQPAPPARLAAPERPKPQPIPRATTSTPLQRVPNHRNFVKVSDGRMVTAEQAEAAGYVVEPVEAPVLTAAEVHRAAVLALPEAAGRTSSAEYLASTGMPLDRAARFLAGAPLDGAAA